MSQPPDCRNCGAELGAGELAAGLCPKCLLKLGLEGGTETGSLTPPPHHAADELPDRIGPYKIVGLLGEGGMGVVYEAEQPSPRRKVAVKVIRGGQYVDDARVQMFRREADTLARLKHPNIAAIYDAGRTDDGQHFFAMELVRGETLDSFIGKRTRAAGEPELRFRLALFRKIADAVHYAHQRGVIHRDLKPGNIIVTAEGSSGDLPEIKILDFGLARITEGDVAAATLTFEVGVVKGTLPYMSPEQARGKPDEIDVRTDVYALGVILYEMLSGQRPYDVMKGALVEAIRVICEEDPAPLHRMTTLVRKIDPDVETIVGKALEKEKDRRYASASVLSEDVDRYLTSQPLLARPPSASYQLKKLVERNKLPAAFATTVLALLVVFGVWMTVLYRRSEANLERAMEAEAEASREADTAKQVSELMIGLFETSNPAEARGRSITAREILDQGAEKVERELSEEPRIQARLLESIGRVYSNLAIYEKAHPMLEDVLARRTRLLGESDPETLQGMHHLAMSYFGQGRYEEAERVLRKGWDIRRRTLGDEDPETLHFEHSLAVVLGKQGRHDEAGDLQEEILRVRRDILGEEHPDTLWAMNSLAVTYHKQGRNDEAEELFIEMIDAKRRVLGDDHFDTLFSVAALAIVYERQGKFEEAAELHRETLESRARTLGNDHPDTLMSMNNVANSLTRLGHYDEAERIHRENLQASRRVLGPSHPNTLQSLNNLAVLHSRLEQWEKAESYFLEALEETRRVLDDDHEQTLTCWNNLINLYRRTGRLDKAGPFLEQLLSARERAARRPNAGPEAKNAYAWSLLTWEREDLREPETALKFAIEANEATDFEDPNLLDTLSLAYHMTGDTEKAVENQKRAISLLPDGADRTGYEKTLSKYEAAMKNGRP